MIGNDIVDLHLSRVESNWRRPGWTAKVCTPGEEAYLARSSDPDTALWLLWSMKESAYKLWNRQSRLSRCNPSSFSCEVIKEASGIASGTVRYGRQLWQTDSFICADYIHTIAWEENNQDAPSVYIGRTGSLGHMLPGHHCMARDQDGIPYLADKRTGRHIPASFSHHGRFEALAASLNQPL